MIGSDWEVSEVQFSPEWSGQVNQQPEHANKNVLTFVTIGWTTM